MKRIMFLNFTVYFMKRIIYFLKRIRFLNFPVYFLKYPVSAFWHIVICNPIMFSVRIRVYTYIYVHL